METKKQQHTDHHHEGEHKCTEHRHSHDHKDEQSHNHQEHNHQHSCEHHQDGNHDHNHGDCHDNDNHQSYAEHKHSHAEHDHDHKHNHSHHHGHNHHHHGHDHGEHGHSHNHGPAPVIFYASGLVLFCIAHFMPITEFWRNLAFVIAMLLAGHHVMIEGIIETITETIRLKKFTPNVHILMVLAAIGASFIGDFDEGALLIMIFAGAHFLEDYAEGRSRREITNLLQMNPTEARLLQADGSTKLVLVSQLQIGDTLQVLPGDQVPTDGRVLTGSSSINEASINGESIPKEKNIGDDVFGSTVNGTGTFTMTVTKDSSETVFAKIIEMVNQSQRDISKTATTIKKLEPKYVTLVLIAVILFILAGPIFFKLDWYTSFYRGMVMLISASPCALAASAIPATLSAISNLAKRGVLFKGGSYLANLANIKAVAFDKTGTLTAGKPSVTDDYFIDKTKENTWISILVAMEKSANHPLADAIIEKFLPKEKLNLDVENKIGTGLITTYNGKHYQVGKPTSFTNVGDIFIQKQIELERAGKTVVFFGEEGLVVGLVAMMDMPTESAKAVVNYLAVHNIHTVMITGDSAVTGEAVAAQLGIEQVIGNVLPENKATTIQTIQKQYGATVMVGDGINDAPALVTADIGFAMGDGTDIAIDVSDAVIMQNDLTKFSYAHKVAKKLDKIVWQNIYFSMFIVVLLLVLNFIGKIDIGLGVLAHEGSTIVVILNGLRLLKTLE